MFKIHGSKGYRADEISLLDSCLRNGLVTRALYNEAIAILDQGYKLNTRVRAIENGRRYEIIEVSASAEQY